MVRYGVLSAERDAHAGFAGPARRDFGRRRGAAASLRTIFGDCRGLRWFGRSGGGDTVSVARHGDGARYRVATVALGVGASVACLGFGLHSHSQRGEAGDGSGRAAAVDAALVVGRRRGGLVVAGGGASYGAGRSGGLGAWMRGDRARAVGVLLRAGGSGRSTG